jgi:catechol 2,3-dioxygenase-like lactoylglutathione lyase family enzyme
MQEVAMYDHLGLRVKDLEASVRFYAAALKELGHELVTHDKSGASLGSGSSPGLWLSADEATHTPLHLAFSARSRSAVDAFHRAGLKAQGRDNGAPGLRGDYGPTYYAAFLLDPDGNNVEAVCQK